MHRLKRYLSAWDGLPGWTVPIAILLLCAISYGTMIPKLGLHWDDWTIAYYIHFLGPSSFAGVGIADRPLAGGMYVLTTSLLGESAITWQVFGLLTRWGLSFALWWALTGLWPQKRNQITSVVFIFTVYPGFNQQYIAITWSNWFIVFTLFLVSIGTMIWAFRKHGWFWPFYIGSIAMSGLAMFTVEYFFGLEFLRPVILWLVLSESVVGIRDRLKRVALYWSPYTVWMLLFLTWRLSNKTPRGGITLFEDLRTNPVGGVLEFGRTVLQDIGEAGITTWIQAFLPSTILNFEPVTILKFSALILGTSVLVTLYLLFLSLPQGGNSTFHKPVRNRWEVQALVLGFFAMALGGIPVWPTNLRIELSFPWDRFTLAMMLGAALFFVGLVELVTRSRWKRALIVGIAVGFAAGMHFQSALSFRMEWLMQRDFFWQLAWRAPGIQPGTLLLTAELPFQYNTDNSLTAPINWMYPQDKKSPELSYLLYDIKRELIDPKSNGTAIDAEIRTLTFYGNTSQAIAVIYHPPACLRVIDPLVDRRLPDRPLELRQALPLSNPDLINPDADPSAAPPYQYFGPEPDHDWCHAFQKADLARRNQDWQTVVDIGEDVLGNDLEFSQKHAPELIPFIEGYAHTGQWQKAVDITLTAQKTWENIGAMLCDTWARILQTTVQDAMRSEALERIQDELQCGNP